MTYDIPTLTTLLKKRVKDNNGLTNADAEYRSDIDEVVSFHINNDLGINLIVPSVGNDFTGTTTIDGSIFAAMIFRAEMHIIDRLMEQDTLNAISADTPAGRFNLREIPTLRNSIRRKNIEDAYDRAVHNYLYGISTGAIFGFDLRELVRIREVPVD